MKDTIILIGMTGCGKSTVGRKLSESLGYAFVDMDDYIEKKAEQTITELFQISEDYFRTLESSACEDMKMFERTVIATGGGAILKQENREALHQAGWLVWIDRPLEAIISDIRIKDRPLLSSGKERLYGMYKERQDIYRATADHVIKNIHSLDVTINQLAAVIKNKEKE